MVKRKEPAKVVVEGQVVRRPFVWQTVILTLSYDQPARLLDLCRALK